MTCKLYDTLPHPKFSKMSLLWENITCLLTYQVNLNSFASENFPSSECIQIKHMQIKIHH